MGYSEVLCNICGVSFNIGRIRRPEEPRSTAWSSDGAGYVNGTRNSHIGECHRSDGCLVVPRKFDHKYERRRAPTPFAYDSSNAGSDYVDQSSGNEDPLEYQSDYSDFDIEVEDAGSDEARPTTGDSSTEEAIEDHIGDFWRRTYDTGHGLTNVGEHLQEQSQPLFRDQTIDPALRGEASENGSDASFCANPDCEPGTDEYNKQRLDHYIYGKLSYDHNEVYEVEHIAGPGCRNRCGYSGHRISVEEMKGCLTFQALERKRPDWEPADDDEDFEREGEFFLTGLSDQMPSRDSTFPYVRPSRHRVESTNAENSIWWTEEAETCSMPFHPSCLEVYKRASKLHLGSIDIEGLTGWWQLEANHDVFFEFPRHGAVKRSTSQWWSHTPEDEFLAANPLFVPSLDDILRSAVSKDPTFNIHDGAFSNSGHTMSFTTDHFGSLPDEVRMEILYHLHSKDIAPLRLASRTFRQLPISLWYRLLRTEIPSLWEAWCDMPFAYWTTISAKQAGALDDEHAKRLKAREDKLQILREEMPELYDAVASSWDEPEPYRGDPLMPLQLSYAQTDWYQLYLNITRNWSNLKGLQNRARIWKDCEEILRRITQYREDGHIPVEDVRAIVQASVDRRIADNRARSERREREQEWRVR